MSEVNIQLHYETVLAYLGTGTGTMTCDKDFVPGLGIGKCTQSLDLPTDSVVVKLSAWDGPPRDTDVVDMILNSDPSATPVSMSGLPAVERPLPTEAAGTSAAEAITEWTLTRPGLPYGAYVLTEYLQGPDLDTAESGMSDLLSSITIADSGGESSAGP